MLTAEFLVVRIDLPPVVLLMVRGCVASTCNTDCVLLIIVSSKPIRSEKSISPNDWRSNAGVFVGPRINGFSPENISDNDR